MSEKDKLSKKWSLSCASSGPDTLGESFAPPLTATWQSCQGLCLNVLKVKQHIDAQHSPKHEKPASYQSYWMLSKYCIRPFWVQLLQWLIQCLQWCLTCNLTPDVLIVTLTHILASSINKTCEVSFVYKAGAWSRQLTVSSWAGWCTSEMPMMGSQKKF